MMRRLPSVTALVAVFLTLPALAQAATMAFDVQGQSNAGLLGDVGFSYDQATATIEIKIKNASTLSGGTDPRLTGFAFNAPSTVTGVSAFSSSPLIWNMMFQPNGLDTPTKIGLFDIGAESDDNGNLNGNDPNNGIARNAENTFRFTLQGTGLSTLTEMSFLGLSSALLGGEGGGDAQYFAARFQRTGANGKDSDVAVPTGQPHPQNASVPEPAVMALLGLGLFGLAWRASRGRIKAQ